MTCETICVEMPCEQAAELYRFCSEHRLTLDELVDQFLRWCVREPEAFMEWYEKCEKEEPSPMNRTPGMPEITQDELIAHIEDENFLRVYGNPVLVRSNDGAHDCVLMSVEYYERMERKLKEMKERICALCDAGMESEEENSDGQGHSYRTGTKDE